MNTEKSELAVVPEALMKRSHANASVRRTMVFGGVTLVTVLGMAVANAALTHSEASGPFPRALCGCPGGPPTPGWTELYPLHWNSAEQISLRWSIYDIQGEYGNQWSYRFPQVSDPELAGAVSVTTYQALHSSDGAACLHGAHFDVLVSDVTGLPSGQTLGWLQLARCVGDALGAFEGDTPGWNIDPDKRLTLYQNEDDARPSNSNFCKFIERQTEVGFWFSMLR